MTKEQRLRRVILLCCHALRNSAYYKAGWEGNELVVSGDYWNTIIGNALDIHFMEWCKLFAEPNGEHFWRKVIDDQNGFKESLLSTLDVSQEDFDTYIEGVRNYRDKFVAHLDSELQMSIPCLDISIKSTKYLHGYLVNKMCSGDICKGLPIDPDRYYRDSLEESHKIYRLREV